MRTVLPALLSGALLGAGLALSDMINPARVLAFLDIAGAWDATLVFVMGGAVAAAAIGYIVARRMHQPLLGSRFFIPENRALDARLVLGAALFGIGWGLAGVCPGPAVAALVFGLWQPWVFFLAMVAGMLLHRVLTERTISSLLPEPFEVAAMLREGGLCSPDEIRAEVEGLRARSRGRAGGRRDSTVAQLQAAELNRMSLCAEPVMPHTTACPVSVRVTLMARRRTGAPLC